MSELIKIYVDTEERIPKVRALLYNNGISTITQNETQINKSTIVLVGLYIDSDQRKDAVNLLNSMENNTIDKLTS